MTIATGVAVPVLLVLALRADPVSINPPLHPLTWPSASPAAIGALLVGALPMIAVPPTPTSRDRMGEPGSAALHTDEMKVSHA